MASEVNKKDIAQVAHKLKFLNIKDDKRHRRVIEENAEYAEMRSRGEEVPVRKRYDFESSVLERKPQTPEFFLRRKYVDYIISYERLLDFYALLEAKNHMILRYENSAVFFGDKYTSYTLNDMTDDPAVPSVDEDVKKEEELFTSLENEMKKNDYICYNQNKKVVNENLKKYKLHSSMENVRKREEIRKQVQHELNEKYGDLAEEIFRPICYI